MEHTTHSHSRSKIERKNLFDLIRQGYFQKVQITAVQDGDKHFSVTASTSNTSNAVPENNNNVESAPIIPQTPTTKGLTCRLCGITSFESVEKQHIHYKSSWHKFNLKLSMNGGKSVSQSEFNQILEGGELSDDSGQSSSDDEQESEDSASEPEEEEEEDTKITHRSPKVVFSTNTSTRFSVWKRVLLDNEEEDNPDFVGSLRKLQNKVIWTFLMCSGGHFAGAVFRDLECIKHKTFHRYTTRKKQGGTQSTRDNKSATSQPKSAGANIRRQNEKKLIEDIHEVLESWSSELKASHRIFLVAPGQGNKHIFFYPESPLQKNDTRIRSVPFTTKRPTLIEIKRAQQILTTVEFFDASTEIPQTTDIDLENEEQMRELLQDEYDFHLQEMQKMKLKSKKPKKQTQPKQDDNTNQNAAPQPDLILDAVQQNNLNALKQLYDNDYVSPIPQDATQLVSPLYVASELGFLEIVKYLVEEQEADVDFANPKPKFRTALHAASENGHEEVVKFLLQAGANPEIKDLTSQSAVSICKNKSTRNVFRKFAAQNPSQWNWTSISVDPLTDEMEIEQQKKEAEKKKKKKKQQQNKQKQKKEQEKQQKEVEEQKKQQEAEKKELDNVFLDRLAKMSTLSDREMRARAAEVRMMQAQGNLKGCDNCGKPLTMIPFERMEYKYCSTACVAEHKKSLESNKK